MDIVTALEGITGVIEKISKGELTVEIVGKERNDEIGALARAFDRTIVSLKLAMLRTGIESKKPESKKFAEELFKIGLVSRDEFEKFKKGALLL